MESKYCMYLFVSQIITANGYAENVNLSNLKMGLGLVACTIALVAQFFPKKFPANKGILIWCIALYVIVFVILQLIMYFKEKNHILFTHPLQDSFSSTGLAISSKFPRFSDLYTLEIASVDPKSLSANPPVEFTKSVTKWFTKDGVLVEGFFREDVENLLNKFTLESRKGK
ncbi:hypothetical protein KP509_37G034000 [Ceratopteris richardii]|uniref:Signal peptidase complex subunit 2 n=1 Tax=Ceratopteris richardii TaxID=49495 RepID=A0A8T2Q7X6_CERRI|nr:hypothetical protein KP509_37G034000 [Ceratopteris richardii]